MRTSPVKRRQPSASALLARIRRHDFAAHSDSELRLAAQHLRSRASEAAEDLLPECFAIVAEAIDRRLGVWRLFADSFPADFFPEEASGVDSQLIAETAEDVARQRTYRRPGDILLHADLYRVARRQDSDGRLRFRPTGEQLLAGIHLFQGKVVQMDAGEGKTVAIAFAAVLHALLDRRVHVITANDYLAERDAALLEPVYRSLGLSAGAVLAHMEEGERRHIYQRGIVYGSMRELGFDFLRDNLKATIVETVQQPLEAAIVDEADHALIDEAFMPLIISGNPAGGARMAVRVNGVVSRMIELQRDLVQEIAERVDSPESTQSARLLNLATLLLADSENPTLLQRFAARPPLRRQAWALAEDDYAELSAGLYYAVHPGSRFVTLTEKGRGFLDGRLGAFRDGGGPDSRDPGNDRLTLHKRRRRADTATRRLARWYALENQVSQSLTAHLLLKRDVDYLVDDDGIVLVDPHTGRPKPDSIYQHGLQEAVEAREGVSVRPERETLAQVSVSGFVSRYQRIAGITGTAASAAGEFRRKYGLEVAVLPPVNPSLRSERPPRVYLDRQDKLAAVACEIASRHHMGQPVLAGTRTVEQSEELGRLLEAMGVPHRVLNAVTTHSEAIIVRDAGVFGSVTVATHMAGRGTDILLESGLNTRIAKQCADEIHRVLTDEAGDIAVVEVSCPSPEQAAVLADELERAGAFDTEPEASGGVLRVSLRGGSGGRSGRGRLDFALGLCVIGTEIHDSARITLQLNGRSGRQGQFGLTQTFLSLEDRLVNLDADAILRLTACRLADAAGRAYYSGPEVTRRIKRLQDAADREGEVQRALIQDYAAEMDRQTHLYYQRRRQLMDRASGLGSVAAMCREITERVASRLAAAYLGPETDGDYVRRFEAMAEEAHLDYGVDPSLLYGLDLALLPNELARLLTERLDQRASLLSLSKGRAGVFPELARLLYLQVCGDLWPSQIAILRDSIASQLLGSHSHKSAVAQYIRRSAESWSGFWDQVDTEFLSRLSTLPLDAHETLTVSVSSETELLLAQETSSPPGRGLG